MIRYHLRDGLHVLQYTADDRKLIAVQMDVMCDSIPVLHLKTVFMRF